MSNLEKALARLWRQGWTVWQAKISLQYEIEFLENCINEKMSIDEYETVAMEIGQAKVLLHNLVY